MHVCMGVVCVCTVCVFVFCGTAGALGMYCLCVYLHTGACPLCVTHGISQTSGGSYGKDAGVYEPAWEEVSHVSTKCCSSNLFPFLLCMEIAETLKASKGSMTFLLPACLANEFHLNPCCLQPKEKGVLELRRGSKDSIAHCFFFHCVLSVCFLYVQRTREGEKKGRGRTRESDGKDCLNLDL